MDRNVLKQRMRERFEAAMAAAFKAVEEAPDGQWITGSEWAVREAFQALTAECFREILQGRIDTEPSASQAAFFPCGKPGGGAAQQRGSRGAGVDRRG